ncbi:MAG: hypothetical protein ACI8SI_002051, partial [Congregibacter sp.]
MRNEVVGHIRSRTGVIEGLGDKCNAVECDTLLVLQNVCDYRCPGGSITFAEE